MGLLDAGCGGSVTAGSSVVFLADAVTVPMLRTLPIRVAALARRRGSAAARRRQERMRSRLYQQLPESHSNWLLNGFHFCLAWKRTLRPSP